MWLIQPCPTPRSSVLQDCHEINNFGKAFLTQFTLKLSSLGEGGFIQFIISCLFPTGVTYIKFCKYQPIDFLGGDVNGWQMMTDAYQKQ